MRPGRLFPLFLMLITGFCPLLSQEVVINEFLASNSGVGFDPDFRVYSDWIELFNPREDSIDLGGYSLSDDLGAPGKWVFPEAVWLAPGDFMLVWADGRDSVRSAFHCGFKLSSRGEEIAIANRAGEVIDSVVFGRQSQDISMGRQPDGGSAWYFFDEPTPGGSNTSDIYQRSAVPLFSLQAGFYSSEQVLEITTGDTLAVIRYTTNGDEPKPSSPIYAGPIHIASRAGEANIYSEIRTNRDPYLWLPDWIPPEGEVFKATVIRARSYRDGFEPSETVTRSYFVDEDIESRYPTLPVISVNTDRDHLFSNNNGIYVPGVNHQYGQSGTGNYFMGWEKPAHIEFFEPGGTPGFAQDVGISIQGGTSPASPQKGLHVIARGEYGRNRIVYPLFETDPSKAGGLTEFKRFIIRAWGSLITGSLFNDAYAHRLIAENDLDIQAYRPVVVFINGEYWGLHALREANKNSWYYQYHHGIDRDDPGCDILLHSFRNGRPFAYIDEGNANHWNAMMDFISSHDMTEQANYDYLKTRMDIDNFITYVGHCIYVAKWDWPNNNDASWRPRTPDGRWRWIQFDMETGFGVGASLGPEYESLGPQLNMFEAAIRGVYIPNFGTYGPHPILSRIYNNKEFSEAFVDWFVERFDHEFHPDTMNRMLDEMAAELRPYMAEYRNRWPFIGEERGSWEESLANIRAFNNRRQDYVKAQLLELYNTAKIHPAEVKLLQNRPNPFVSSTTIHYQLPEAATVELRIYNTGGRLIQSYSRQHGEGGHYSVQWDPGNQSSGLYFLSMQTEGFYKAMRILKLEGE